MKRLDRIDVRLTSGLAAAMVCLCAAPAPAQTPAKKPTQPPVSGPGSINGIWNASSFSATRTGPPTGEPRVRPTADGLPPPMQPWAAAVVAKRIQDFKDGHPIASMGSKCLPNGMPGAMTPAPELPIEILETPGRVTVLIEEMSTFRTIRLNAPHQTDPDPSFMGDAVGHWEGDTLVVDTIGMNDQTMIQGLIPHTEALHLIEHIRRTGKDTMEDRITIDDPKTFTRPWTIISSLKHVSGMELQEFYCENNRNPADANGNTGVQIR